MDHGNWDGIKIENSGPKISHIMFTDDVLLSGNTTVRPMYNVLIVINKLCSVFGQRINYDKSNIIFSSNMDVKIRKELSQFSGVKETKHLVNYLRVPITSKNPRNKDFQHTIDKIHSKLSTWKAKNISMAGRITLAKVILEVTHIYYVMSNRILKFSLKEIQKIQRNFVWDDMEHKPLCLIKWGNIAMKKTFGGLRLRKPNTVNNACIAKLSWNFYKDNKAL